MNGFRRLGALQCLIIGLACCSLCSCESFGLGSSGIHRFDKSKVVKVGWSKFWTEQKVGAKLGAYGIKRSKGSTAFIHRSVIPGLESSVEVVAHERRSMSPDDLVRITGPSRFKRFAGVSLTEALAAEGYQVEVDFVALELDRVRLITALNADNDVLSYFRDVGEDGLEPRIVVRNVVLLNHEFKRALEDTEGAILWLKTTQDSRPRSTLELRSGTELVATIEEPKIAAYHLHAPIFKPNISSDTSRISYLLDEQPGMEFEVYGSR